MGRHKARLSAFRCLAPDFPGLADGDQASEMSAGSALTLSFLALAVGAIMCWIRGGTRGGAPPTQVYFLWERSFIVAAVVMTAVGFALLDSLLQDSAGRVLARAGAADHAVLNARRQRHRPIDLHLPAGVGDLASGLLSLRTAWWITWTRWGLALRAAMGPRRR